MAKPRHIELEDGPLIPILYEDRAVMAIDKPAGWMLAPDSWDRTGRNLQLALVSSVQAGAWWARSRNLKFIRYVHRLDAETSGILLLARHLNVVAAYSRLFARGETVKHYLAVVRGKPRQTEWTCRLPLAPDPQQPGRMLVDRRRGQAAETRFHVLESGDPLSLVEARPRTGRTHQIRVHLAAEGCPVAGDGLYGDATSSSRTGPFGLRATVLEYPDPFQKRRIHITAPIAPFCRQFGFRTGLPSLGTAG